VQTGQTNKRTESNKKENYYTKLPQLNIVESGENRKKKGLKQTNKMSKQAKQINEQRAAKKKTITQNYHN
jgi:hypothetical protein